MKNVISGLIILFMSILESNAQSTKLDEKNGFNVFVLGSSLKEVKAVASLQKLKDISDKNYVYYGVKNLDKYKLIDNNLSSIQLVFFRDRLLEINLYLSYFKTVKDKFVSTELAQKISNEYGSWHERELSAVDRSSGLSMKFDITGNNVILIRYVFTHRFDNNTFGSYGDRYCFISDQVYREAEKQKGNGL